MMQRSTKPVMSTQYTARNVVDAITHRASLIGGKFIASVANDLDARTHRINAVD